MVGVNHHFRTTVFGVALLADETSSTFIWVLQQFLDCMDGKHPKVVVTDSDHAMRVAIGEVFPTAIHRLCAWHLDKNACSNVPSGEFKIQFTKLMYIIYSKEEFEELWEKVINDHNLEDNDWATLIYAKRKSWAETFLRGNFFGGMRTTQRCESMNSYMRRSLEHKQLLRIFVSQIDEEFQNIHYTKRQDDFNSKHTKPYIPISDTLLIYHEQFASTFIRNVYQMVAKEIEGQNLYSISSCDYTHESSLFKLSRFRFGEIRHHVRYFTVDNKFECSCLLLETDGIPCRHIFTVMKHLSIDRIPSCLMRNRWRKDAKTCVTVIGTSSSISPDALEIARLGTLASDFNTLGLYASKFDDTFLQARDQFKSMTETFKDVYKTRQGEAPTNLNFDEGLASSNNIIKEPVRANTNG